jgi:hypothetical protein
MYVCIYVDDASRFFVSVSSSCMCVCMYVCMYLCR